jgi:hypothetical protein
MMAASPLKPHAAVELQPADPQLRRLAILLCLALVVVGAVSLWELQSWLSSLAQTEPSVARRRLLVAFGGLMSTAIALLWAMSVYLWRTAARVRRAALFPPPGMRVLRDTAILRGTGALQRARLIRAMAIALLVGCVALVGVSWRVYTAIANHAV